MYWYKVKSMLIVLFLLINIFLVGTICYGYVSDIIKVHKISAETEKVLEKNLITPADGIPRDRGPVPSATLTAIFEKNNEQIKFVLGGDPTTTSYEQNGTVYMRGSKKILVNGAYFEYEDASQKPLSKVSEENIRPISAQLKKLGIDLSHTQAFVSGNTILYRYYLDKKPIFNAYLSVAPSDGGICRINGHALLVEPGITQIKTRPAAKAAMDFLQTRGTPNAKETITKFELGYSLFLGDADVNFKSTEAIPTWQITLKNGDFLYYDARNN